jgi:hypothetical protein
MEVCYLTTSLDELGLIYQCVRLTSTSPSATVVEEQLTSRKVPFESSTPFEVEPMSAGAIVWFKSSLWFFKKHQSLVVGHLSLSPTNYLVEHE